MQQVLHWFTVGQVSMAACMKELTLQQAVEHEKDLHSHQSLSATPGRDGDSERVEQPTCNTSPCLLLANLICCQQALNEPTYTMCEGMLAQHF